MITDASEFKQRLQSIQQNSSVVYTTLPSSEPRLIIDANSREISVPVEFDFLAVKNDHKAETIYFEIDRYFDNCDLSEHTCVVQWSNSGDEGIAPCTELDVETFEGKIIFGWEITSDCTSIPGDISFSVRFYTIDEIGNFEYNFNTLPAVSKILDTLNAYGDKEPASPSSFQVLADRVYFLEKNCATKEDLEGLDVGGIDGIVSSDKTITIANDGENTDLSVAISAEDGNALTKKADGLYVDKPVVEEDVFGDVVALIGCGGISAGTSLKGKTVKDVLVMLLGIQKPPASVVEDIMRNKIPSYSGLEGQDSIVVPYVELDAETTDEADQGFYTVTDNGEITNAGYQMVFEGNTEGIAQTFEIFSSAKIVTAYQYQPAFNQWLDIGFDGTYWIENGTTTKTINGREISYTAYIYNKELMGDVITSTEYWRFEVEV